MVAISGSGDRAEIARERQRGFVDLELHQRMWGKLPDIQIRRVIDLSHPDELAEYREFLRQADDAVNNANH